MHKFSILVLVINPRLGVNLQNSFQTFSIFINNFNNRLVLAQIQISTMVLDRSAAKYFFREGPVNDVDSH